LRETIILLALSLISASAVQAENWERFRGPNGAGQSDAAGIPTEWSESNFLWKQPLPGVGHSSPVIWDRHLFVTSADPKTGEKIILAFDALSGRPLWTRRHPGSTYSMHAFNSYASCTPAVDAENVYVAWRDGTRIKLLALTHEGDEAWQADAGISEEKHGFGTSPVVIDDVVCLENDNDTTSEIVAYDCETGDVRWRLPRAAGKTSFCTPCVLESGDGKKLLLVSSNASGLTAIDVSTGRVAWQAVEHELPERSVASPVVASGLVFVSCGQGGNGIHMIAVRPPNGTEDAREVYRLRQGIPNVPTAVEAGDSLFLWHDNGTVTCLDASTGRQHWRERVGGDFHASPIRVGNRIFGVSLDGEVSVLSAEPQFNLLARNSLGEPTRATPAVAHERMYLRTESSLICIGEPGSNN
jgi:outer membrane protein assembly factor BamB